MNKALLILLLGCVTAFGEINQWNGVGIAGGSGGATLIEVTNVVTNAVATLSNNVMPSITLLNAASNWTFTAVATNTSVANIGHFSKSGTAVTYHKPTNATTVVIATNAFTITTNTLAFNTVYTNGTRRASVSLVIVVGCAAEGQGYVSVNIEDNGSHSMPVFVSSDTSSVSEYVPVHFVLSPGATFSVANVVDDLTVNAIESFKVWEW